MHKLLYENFWVTILSVLHKIYSKVASGLDWPRCEDHVGLQINEKFILWAITTNNSDLVTV